MKRNPILELLQCDPRPVELASGLAALTWGLILVAPGSAFDSSIAYNWMRFLPEWAWALLLIVAGGVQLAACLWNSVLLRQYASFGAALFWAFVGAAFWEQSRSRTFPGMACWPMLTASQVWATAQLAGAVKRNGVEYKWTGQWASKV